MHKKDQVDTRRPGLCIPRHLCGCDAIGCLFDVPNFGNRYATPSDWLAHGFSTGLLHLSNDRPRMVLLAETVCMPHPLYGFDSLNCIVRWLIAFCFEVFVRGHNDGKSIGKFGLSGVPCVGPIQTKQLLDLLVPDTR